MIKFLLYCNNTGLALEGSERLFGVCVCAHCDGIKLQTYSACSSKKSKEKVLKIPMSQATGGTKQKMVKSSRRGHAVGEAGSEVGMSI